MRCSAIAEEALNQGIECVFVGDLGGVEWLENHFLKIQCPVTPLKGFGLARAGDVLVLDSYSIQSNDSFLKKNSWAFNVDIADEATPSRDADLIIHTGLDDRWFKGNRASFLFGSRFIPIRKSITKSIRPITSTIDKILIFGGGVDAHGFAREISQELCNISGFRTAVFISTEQQWIEELDFRFQVIPFGAALDRELDDADLVFTTASTSSLEVLACELPLGVGCSVENQFPYYKAIGEAGVGAQIGQRINSEGWQFHSDVIRKLISDPEIRQNMRESARDYIDLSGSKRIVDSILALTSDVNRE